MNAVSQALIVIGGLLLAGLLAHFVGSKTKLPRVTLLLILGILAGPTGFDLLPPQSQDWFSTTATMALSMVGFLIGGELRIAHLKRDGRTVLIVTAAASLLTATIVALGLWLAGTPIALALTLGGIATATDAAATVAVLAEAKQKSSAFSRLLLRVVALDDVVALLLFSFLVALGTTLTPGPGGASLLSEAAREILGATGVGFALGYPAAKLTGRIKQGQPLLEEALALLCLCAGISTYLHVSPLLAAITMGATIANFAAHHTRAFRQIESIEWPFLVVFFVLAGAALDVSKLSSLGLLGLGYVVLRIVGKVAGGFVGARLSGVTSSTRYWLGLALLPQAGVALGLALAAAERFPMHADDIISITIVTTVLFELVGPVLAAAALRAQNSKNPQS